jgi:recombinational DNA repair ATPase RecF
MKILELEIKNIRGIKDLTLSPNGKTIVVWGPNGTGKSGVIDSVDFLLTGKVTRLTGKGTKSLSLKTHGSHIDSSGDDAYVKAKVQINDSEEPIELFREMSNPTKLEISGCDEKIIAPIISIAERGQHVLTRREILEYITSEPSSRAQQIQMLLNVNEIEKIRKNFVKISNKASKSVAGTHKALEQAKFGLLSTTQDENYTDEAILKFINSYRDVLNGLPVQELNSNFLKKDISSPKLVKSTNADNNISIIEKHIQNILQIVNNQEAIANIDLSLKNAINKVHESPELIVAFKRKNLIKLGIEAINSDNLNNCPLCDTEWEELKLNEYLQKKLKTIDTLSQYNKSIEDNISFLKKEGNLLLSNLERIINIVKIVPELAEYEELLNEWENILKEFIESLEYPLTHYLNFNSKKNNIDNFFAPNNIKILLYKILATLSEKFPKSSIEQTAWDILTRLEENIKAIELSEIEYSNSKFLAKRANTLSFEFEKSRDKILNELYEIIQERFVALYRDLHGDDEKDFTAKLEPKGAALNFEVNFHGRGSHPPHALHSEGHQDSMGLCLFLALSEYLAKGIVDVLLLDDVVMSVDSEHRRSLCKLIVSNFPNKQFIITTHDKTWANQLKTEGWTSSEKWTLSYLN